MKLLQFPLTKITILFILGILFSYYTNIALSRAIFFFIFSLSLFGITSLIRKIEFKDIYFINIIFINAFCLGIFIYSIHNEKLNPKNYTNFVQQEKQQTIEVELTEKLRNSINFNRFVAKVISIDNQQCNGKILLNIKNDTLISTLKIGHILRYNSTVNQHFKPNNPDQFDYGKYLENKSILAQSNVSVFEIETKGVHKSLAHYASEFRNQIIRNLQKNGFPNTELQVVNALILGQQQEISQEIITDYQYAGAIHILSVSGLHIGIILLMLNYFLDYLPKTRTYNVIKSLIIICSIWSFALVAGFSPSVVRSVMMFSIVAISQSINRQTNIKYTLLVSLFLILLFKPLYIFDVGFQLSYVALYSILWLQPLFSKFWEPKNKIVKYFWDIITVSFAAQIGVLPLSLYYFHQFPGLFFVTNLIILPLLGFVMAVAVVVLILSYFNVFIYILSFVLEKTIFVLNWIINKIASVESFIITDIPLSKLMMFVFYLTIISFFIFIENKKYYKLVCFILSILLFQSIFFIQKNETSRANNTIVFIQKSKTILVERHGKSVSIYTNDTVGIRENKVLKSYLIANFLNISKINLMNNFEYLGNKKIFIIDSATRYFPDYKPDIVLITQSPKINFDRYLKTLQPKMIIADGSNYKSYVSRWKKSCEETKTKFHNTSEKGYFKIDY